MKITKSRLIQIIQEEVASVLSELSPDEAAKAAGGRTVSGLKGPPQLQLASPEAKKEYYSSPGQVRDGKIVCDKESTPEQRLCYNKETGECVPC